MKKLLSFLKKYWLLIAGGLIILYLFVSGSFDSCSKKHVDTVIVNSEIVELRQNLIDSVRKVSDKEKLREIDLIQAIHNKTVTRLKKQVSVLESDLQARIDIFDQDTTDLGDECDYRLSVARSIIDDCQTVNDTLHSQLRAQESLTVTAMAKDSIHLTWYNQEKTDHAASDKSVEDLRAALKAQTTSWKRNEKYVYGGIGFVIPIILKLLLK